MKYFYKNLKIRFLITTFINLFWQCCPSVIDIAVRAHDWLVELSNNNLAWTYTIIQGWVQTAHRFVRGFGHEADIIDGPITNPDPVWIKICFWRIRNWNSWIRSSFLQFKFRKNFINIYFVQSNFFLFLIKLIKNVSFKLLPKHVNNLY